MSANSSSFRGSSCATSRTFCAAATCSMCGDFDRRGLECLIRESLRSHSLKPTQPSTRNDPVKKTANANPKKLSHTKSEVEATNQTCQRPLSPSETPGPGTPGPANVHLQPTGLPTVAEDVCLLESLLESALAALVAIRSTPTPNPTSILSQTAKKHPCRTKQVGQHCNTQHQK